MSRHTKPDIVGRLLVLLLGGATALLIAAGCTHRPQPNPHVVAAAQAVVVDEAVCKTCHADTFEASRASNHMHALHVADRHSLGKLAPPVGPIAGTDYEIKAEGDSFFYARRNDPAKRNRLDYAFGSGKLAMTYISLVGDQSATELRMSWYPGKRRWYITPGQESMADEDAGYVHEAAETRDCILCHAVTVASNSLHPEERFFGVGCQSCHGPASLHVAAMQAGQMQDLKIERVGTSGATRINELCGKCHRAPSQVGTSGNEITMTNRFQAYGLMQSRCFQESGDRLSCVTCHDPHTNLAKSPRSYEEACLRCHGGEKARETRPALMRSKICPVNATERCISCHMPTRRVFPASQIPIAMADHLIWAYRKKPQHGRTKQSASAQNTGSGHSHTPKSAVATAGRSL